MYYERQEESLASGSQTLVTPEKRQLSLNEDVNDNIWLCASTLQSLSSDQDEWVSAGQVGISFRSFLPNQHSGMATKEENSLRFKNARDTAVIEGLIEIGRRRLDTLSTKEGKYEYVVVPLNAPWKSDSGLSPEMYLRLLPSGRELALQAKPENDDLSLSTPTTGHDNKDSSVAMLCVFFNNIPPATVATQLVDFLEMTFDYAVERVELEENNWKGSMCTAAHIQFPTSNQASTILKLSKTSGLIYRGRRLFAVADRTTPDEVASRLVTRPPEMSFTKHFREGSPDDSWSSAAPLLVEKDLDDLVNETSDIESETKQAEDDEKPKDPFEGLLW